MAPGGRLLALDADPIELPKTAARLRALGYDEDALLVRRTNFAGIQRRPRRGRLGRRRGFPVRGSRRVVDADRQSGARLLVQGGWPARHADESRGAASPPRAGSRRCRSAALASALADYADEPRAAEIAAALVERRGALTDHDEHWRRRSGRWSATRTKGRPIRRVFQAVRIAVNDELGALDALLRQLPSCLRPGGRLALLTFHSGEDRRVKRALDDGVRAGIYSDVPREVVRATAAEQRSNPRAKAAKLRSARRAG